MDFTDTPRKAPAESVVPMINVVFLLLIFFLMTAQIAPPAPMDVDLPEAGGTPEVSAPLPLYLGRDGTLAFRDITGADAVYHALELERISLCADGGCAGREGPAIALHADREAPASDLAALMPRLAALGFSAVELITSQAGSAP